MASSDQRSSLLLSQGTNGEKKGTKEYQEMVFNQVSEMFGAVLARNVIFSVLLNCDWELQPTIESLLKLSSNVNNESTHMNEQSLSNRSSISYKDTRNVQKKYSNFNQFPDPVFLDVEMQQQQEALRKYEKAQRDLNGKTRPVLPPDSKSDRKSCSPSWPTSGGSNEKKVGSNMAFYFNQQQQLQQLQQQEQRLQQHQQQQQQQQQPKQQMKKGKKEATDGWWRSEGQDSKNKDTKTAKGTNPTIVKNPNTGATDASKDPTFTLLTSRTQEVGTFDYKMKMETESLCGLKVQYRVAGLENSSDDDADVVVEEETNEYDIQIPSFSNTTNVCQFLSSPTQSPPRNTCPEVRMISTPSPPRTPQRSRREIVLNRIKSSIESGHKILILLRGMPGSGKSTLAKNLIATTYGCDAKPFIFSADDYFTLGNRGVYKYDPNKLSEAHNYNKQLVLSGCKQGKSPLIVDNTHVQAWEMQPYASMAVMYGYILEILEPDTPWAWNANELAKKNTHGVPKLKIKQMLERFERGISGAKLLQQFSLKYSPSNMPPQYRQYPPLNKSEINVTPDIEEKPKRKRTRKNKKNTILNAHDMEVLQNIDASSVESQSKLNTYQSVTLPQRVRSRSKNIDATEKMEITNVGANFDGLNNSANNTSMGEDEMNDSSSNNLTVQNLGAIGSERKGSISNNADNSYDGQDNVMSQCWDFTLLLDGQQIHSVEPSQVDRKDNREYLPQVDTSLSYCEAFGETVKRSDSSESLKNKKEVKQLGFEEIMKDNFEVPENENAVGEECRTEVAQNAIANNTQGRFGSLFTMLKAILGSEDDFATAVAKATAEKNQKIESGGTNGNLSKCENCSIKDTLTEKLSFENNLLQCPDIFCEISVPIVWDSSEVNETDKLSEDTLSRKLNSSASIDENEKKNSKELLVKETIDDEQNDARESQEIITDILPDVESEVVPSDLISKEAEEADDSKMEIKSEGILEKANDESSCESAASNDSSQSFMASSETPTNDKTKVEEVITDDNVADMKKVELDLCELEKKVLKGLEEHFEMAIPMQSDLMQMLSVKYGVSSNTESSRNDFSQKEDSKDNLVEANTDKKVEDEKTAVNSQTEEGNVEGVLEEADQKVQEIREEINEGMLTVDSVLKTLSEMEVDGNPVDSLTHQEDACINGDLPLDSKKDSSENSELEKPIIKEESDTLEESSTEIVTESACMAESVAVPIKIEDKYSEKSLEFSEVLMDVHSEEVEEKSYEEMNLLLTKPEVEDEKPEILTEEFAVEKAEVEKPEMVDNFNEVTWKEPPFPMDDIKPETSVQFACEEKGRVLSDSSTNTTYYDFNVLYIGGTKEEEYKILSTSSRNINEGFQPVVSEQPPKKLMLDKSSMTNEEAVILTRTLADSGEINEENRITELMEMFPKIPKELLEEIYEKLCNFNFDWAVDVLLEGVPDDLPKYPKDSERNENSTDELKKPEPIKKSHSSSSESNDSEASPQNQRRIKHKRNKQKEKSEDVLLLEKELEEKIKISDVFYHPHILRVKKWKNHEPDATIEEIIESQQQNHEVLQFADPLEDEVEAGGGDNWQDFISLPDDFPETKEDFGETAANALPASDANDANDGDEVIELKLGHEFIQILEAEFGNSEFACSEDLFPVINIKKSMAQQLHGLWIESMCRQLNARQEQLDEMIKKDAELAKSLEQEEARYLTKPKEQNLNEIMDMELALAIYNNDMKKKVERETPNDMASRLTRQRLHEMFPHFEPELLSEILKAHDGNFKETIEVLEASTGQSANCNTNSLQKQQNLLDQITNVLRQPSKNTNQNNEFQVEEAVGEEQDERDAEEEEVGQEGGGGGGGGEEEEEEEEELTYEAALQVAEASREEAQRQYRLRNENFQKATDAYRKKNPQVASYYSQIAKLHLKNMEIANSTAASAFLAAQTYATDKEDTLDLHNLFVSEALQALDVFLDFQMNKLMNSKKRCTNLFIITGRGARSNNGQSKLKPAIARKLTGKNIKFTDENAGCLKITLYRRNAAVA